MQKRNVLNSPRLFELKRHRRKVFLKKILLFGFGLLVVLVFMAYISRINKLNISNIEIVGNKLTDTEMIKAVAQKEIAGNYFWIFPKTNIFFYPKNNIKNELADKFKRLKDIELLIKENKILYVLLSERKALYTWCGEIVDLENECYFLDDSGYIFDEAPYFSGEVYFKFYGPAHFGAYFAEVNFGRLIAFKEALETMELKPVALYIMDNENVKIYLSNESSLSMGPEIIFKINADFQKIAENLQAALTTEPLQSDFKNKYSSLLYIDLQFGNKVYYKFR